MIRLFAHANYDFIGKRLVAYVVTAAFSVPALVLLLATGFNYSIEFTGGTLIQIETKAPTEAAKVRAALADAGIRGAEIQRFGSDSQYSIKARLSAEQEVGEAAAQATKQAVARALDAGLGEGAYVIVRTHGVGPKVGSELQSKALLAILLAFAAKLIYLAFRFEWRFGVAAVLAIANEIVATIAFIRYLNLEVSLVVVAAVLTVLGYSVNDTIVIFDRVRENLRKFRRQNLYDILNLSINETLPRTILTGGSTFATALVLAFFAGEVIKPFGLVMSFGILTGTFSSMYIASPVLLWIERRWPGQDVRGARLLRTTPEAAALPSGAPPPPPSGGVEARPKATV
jgi:preprotein translocase subunit SecF